MLRKLLLAICAVSLCAGCNKREGTDVASVAEGLEERPIVAIVPFFESSNCGLSWNVSEELTSLLYSRLAKRDKFYLTSVQKVAMQVKRSAPTHDPFSLDYSWVKQAFAGSEFVVFLELMEHVENYRVESTLEAQPASYKESSADLNMSVRIRAVDLRGPKPTIALQEMIHVTHHIPRQFTRANFYQVSWKNENFAISPLGIAHVDLIKTVSSRLEEYLLRAKAS